MLCQSCSLKTDCSISCETLNAHLRRKQNYKTTHVNKEVGLSEVSLKHGSYDKWMRSKKNRDQHQFHKTWMKVVRVIETKLTPKQHTIIWMYLDGMSMAEIGRRLKISGQAVNYAIFGHPKQGGGIAKRIRMELGATC